MTLLTPALLTALALVLAGPAPAVLARAGWTARVPRAALVLWQALALAAVLSALGAGLSAAALVLAYVNPSAGVVALHVTALVLTVVVLARLLWSGHTLGRTLRARRRRHRDLVDLVGRDDQRAPGARVVDLDPPLAYCIPGISSRLVISAPALEALHGDEVRAVLAHERAHAKARHDLVLEGFSVVHDAFPRVVRSKAAHDAAAGLVEMLADDAARRQVGAVPLARALARLAHAPVPHGSLGSGAVTPEVRIRRLARADSRPPFVLAASAYAAAVALVIVPTVTVAVPWLTRVVDVLTT
jgi:Zn-dependent protease with chaperone function